MLLQAAALTLIVGEGLLLRSTPQDYEPVQLVEKFNKSGLFGLSLVSQFIYIVLLSTSVYDGLLEQKWSVEIGCWFILALASQRFHALENVVLLKSHHILFLSHGLLLASLSLHLEIPSGIEQWIHISKVGVLAILLLVIGFWSTRRKEDDEDGLSKEHGACIFSQMTLSWFSPMIWLGRKKSLEQSDLWTLLDEDRAEPVSETYFATRNPDHSVGWRILRFSAPYMIAQYVFALVAVVCDFAQPYFLFQIVTALQNGMPPLEILKYLTGMFSTSIANAMFEQLAFFMGQRTGMRSRTVLVEELYTKTLQKVQGAGENTEDEQASLGKIVTLMSVDAERIRWFFFTYTFIFCMLPVGLVISVTGLFTILGWSAFAAVGSMAVMAPLSTYLGKFLINAEQEMLERTDARISLLNEVLQGIRIIKYFSWEKVFQRKVSEKRKLEMDSCYKIQLSGVGYNVIGQSTGIIVAFCTFYVYTVIAGKTLDAAVAFTTIKLLDQLKFQLTQLPISVMDVLQAKVSMDRIGSYLKEKEISRYSQPQEARKVTEVGFKNASFQYYNSSDFKLKNLNLEFPLNKLTVITGPTGSGKSSLLLALLGEMELVEGQSLMPITDDIVYKNGQSNAIAYVAQTAWLLNATVRDNILFGEPYDQERYERVLRGCSLVKDLENLDGGDLTEIGEKGINLSGGQKQRISLARACYSRASIVMLDDPLSAVDAPTARHLLHCAVLDLLKGRTVILVSHATQLVLPFADYVVQVVNGEITCQGSPLEVIQNPSSDTLFGLPLEKEPFEREAEKASKAITKEGGGTTLVQDEEKATGAVKFAVYYAYAVACGGIFFFSLILFGFLISEASIIVTDWWIKVWTDANASPPMDMIQAFVTMMQTKTEDTIFYVGIYSSLGLVSLLIMFGRDWFIRIGGLRASRNLHDQLLERILLAPLRFFETTPAGRILNRFSRDIETIDTQIIGVMEGFLWTVFGMVLTIFMVAAVVPEFLFAAPFLLAIYVFLAKIYLDVSRELKRYESVSKSPIYSQFSETLAGVCTIRAYKQNHRFSALNKSKLDVNNAAFFYNWAANRWLSFRTGLISSIIVSTVVACVILMRISSGWAALIISFSMELVMRMKWAVRTHAQMEMTMNSVERVDEYLQIEQEPPQIVETNRPPVGWPQQGLVTVKDLSIRYAQELPDVLKNVSFQIQPGEKVAVVGRTGAGKSTLSLAFFRIVPFSSGSIEIDGIDIGKIGLHDLRSQLTIIPQDPVLFNGTLRSNLDPLEENNDDAIWQALKRVHFIESLQNNDNTELTLDYSISENGANLSQGQRQLICLARSLLQKNRIIFLDEATASVDGETDARIQTTIREEFEDAVVVCIAHRLKTIIDYDKVLVMDKGQVKEFGSPYELIQKQGQFNAMCQETGEYETLVEMASKH
ncbi:P-loop containing nucleoside triphosphate hydrolase protein [Gorgonomyces haynaldii]|nr:P-loop containing nucleoside triphosphate hydrolase protein [Gorgonomyces haynaldii]